MILKFCKLQQKKIRLKPTEKPYLECVWSKPGNKRPLKYSLAPLCQVGDLTGLIEERWGCSRGCSLQVHCNTPSKLQLTGTVRGRLQFPSLELYSYRCFQQHSDLAGSEPSLWCTGPPPLWEHTSIHHSTDKTVFIGREMRFMLKKIIFWVILQI